MGYVCFFSFSFPLAPLLALINNILELRVDKYKLVKFTKRPIPMGAETINIWRPIFFYTTTLGIFSTLGVMVITDRTWADDLTTDTFSQFVIAAGLCLVFKIIIIYLIPDTPKKYTKVVKRHEFIANKALATVPVETNAEVMKDPAKI